jgi:RNA polymerase sigma-70 factor (ECF subfamily)
VGREVFTAVARKIGDFNPQPRAGSFRAWLKMITHNKVHDWHRVSEPTAQGGSDAVRFLHERAASDAPSGDHDTEDDERTLVLHTALKAIQCEFEAKTWAAFWGVVVDGQSATEVAERLCMSRNSVYLAKSRVIARLREEFDGLVELE